MQNVNEYGRRVFRLPRCVSDPALLPMVVSLIALLLLAAAPVRAETGLTVRFSGDVRKEAYTGRVYVFFSRIRAEPRTGPDWFAPEQFIARDVKNLEPGKPVVFSGSRAKDVLAFPVPFEEMKLDGFRAQAVMRFNPFERNVGTGPGNGYSPAQKLTAAAAKDVATGDDAPGDVVADFTVDALVKPRVFEDTKWSKLLSVRSEKLSRFHKREVDVRGCVSLPASYYAEPKRRYPVLFIIPGFGGTHFSGRRSEPAAERNDRGVEFIRVTLDPSCPLGHHVFADSANNGPWGTALVEEFIPALDEKFRTVGTAAARFLTGHSSGGWSSLWLQITHPDHFGGTWSIAPDPVDFRDYQQVDLYERGANIYVNASGKRRPLARRRGNVLLWYDDFARMEWVLGYGGQLHSFEAVFSPTGSDGRPLLMFDRNNGKVDARIVETWKKYDVRRVLEENWKTLEPKLRGKLHVHIGSDDTFYLDGATVLLKKSLEGQGSDAVVEIHDGKSHGSLMTAELRDRIHREMADAFLESQTKR